MAGNWARNWLAKASLGVTAAFGLTFAATASAEAHGDELGGRHQRFHAHHGVHHHGVHKITRKARTASRAAVKRYRTASWHCNPWTGARKLHGQLFVLGKGYHYGACLEHQTGVARDWRDWQAHDHERGRIHWHSHREHDWLQNADLRRNVR